MGTWGQLLREIEESLPDQASRGKALDAVRRKYLALAYQHTGRATILYATKWAQPSMGPPTPADFIMITNEDVHGFMEAVHGLDTDGLDLILHSPGGQPGAAEAVVTYLRSKFSNIRVIVPHMAMSAATMIACAADKIVMGKHSFLGPIDPQMPLNTALGPRMVPAQAIIEQFDRATHECQDPAKVRAWLPMLAQYGPDLLVTCRNASELAEQLVSEWLASYMFKRQRRRKDKAREVARWLSTHSHFKSHGRPISRDALVQKGLKVVLLEDDQVSQDLFLSVFHAVSHTFTQSGVVKVIENHEGKAFIKIVQQVVMAQQVPAGVHPVQPGVPAKPPEADAKPKQLEAPEREDRPHAKRATRPRRGSTAKKKKKR